MAGELPDKMRFVGLTEPGGPEVLEIRTMPTPVPLAHEVVIKVAAAGINRPDILQRQGKYPPPPGASPVLGLEVAGVVAAKGKDVTLNLGDAVCALVPGGGYAEYCLVPAVQCLSIPRGLSALQAGGIPETFFTVWANVFQIGGLQRGDKPRRFRLQHGDVAVWGGPTRLAFHGVAPLADGEHALMGRQRINLTFRKTR